MPKVSIIVLIYNVEKYLNQCLKSLIEQSYDNIEILCVIDGSTDKSLAICHHFAQTVARVKIIYQKNSGPGAARNNGISHADGDFIVFIDGDDFVTADYVQHLVGIQQEYQCDIAVSSYLRMDEKGTYFVPFYPNPEETKYDKAYSASEWLKIAYEQMGTIFVVPWGKLYRKTLFTHVRYPGHRAMVDDEFTTWKLYLLAHKVAFGNYNDYVYRKNSNSITAQQNNDLIYRQSLALKERIAVMNTAGMDTNYLRSHYEKLLRELTTSSLNNGRYNVYEDAVFQLKVLENARKD